MADPGAGRHDAEIFERALRPFEEAVALLILFVFLIDVLFERGVVAEIIDHDRMIDDEIHRHQRIDLLRIAAEHLHGVAHGGEVDHRGHAGEILHQHARRPKGDFALGGFGLEPLCDRLDVLFGDRAAVFIAQQILKQDLERERQPRNSLEAVLLRDRKAVIGIGLGSDLERPQAFKAIEGGHGLFSHPAGRRPAQVEVFYCRNMLQQTVGGRARQASRTRRLPVSRLIGRFQDLFQFDKGMADMMPGIAGLFGNVNAAFGL